MEIVNHSSCNLVIGAPADMSNGACSSLPVLQHQDENGLWSISFWKPSEEELKQLQEGGYIALWVRASGRQHPVVGMSSHPAEITYSFEQFVQYGRDQKVPLIHNMPWSFIFQGFPVTHENDECYLITKPNGSTLKFTPQHSLIFNSRGLGELMMVDVL